MKKMTKNALLAVLCTSVMFAGCSSDNDNNTNTNENEYNDIEYVDYTPGEIPGLGESRGNLTGKTFVLPESLEIIGGEIWGFGEDDDDYIGRCEDGQKQRPDLRNIVESATRLDLKDYTIIGSGDFVVVYLPLNNTSDENYRLVFPAGLIMKSVSGRAQNGVLLKKTEVFIPAGKSKDVLLAMYCGNASRNASSDTERYVFSVVSDAKPIKDLCTKLEKKKINYEEYPDYFLNIANKDWEAYEDFYFHNYPQTVSEWSKFKYFKEFEYDIYAEILQDMLWKITDDGEPLSDDDIKNIGEIAKSK